MSSTQSLQTYLENSLPRYLAVLKQMVDMNSYSGNAQGVTQLAHFTAECFAPLGFTAEFLPSEKENHGNHLFMQRLSTESLRGTPPSIVMISHLDTVFTPEEEQQNHFSWRIEGDRIYGPGTVDIKGGTVVMLMVMEALKEFFPRIIESTNWLLALNAAEEVLAPDFTQAMLQRMPKSAKACLVFEGGTPYPGLNPDQQAFSRNQIENAYTLVAARKGNATFRVQVEGRGAHSGNYQAQGANAILQLCQTIQSLSEITDYNRKLTVNIGKVQGGTVTNRVPHFAQAQGEMRAFSNEIFQEAIEKIQSHAGNGQVKSQDGFPCKVHIDILDSHAPWPHNPGTEQLLSTWDAVAHQLGYTLTREERGGLSDGNLFWQMVPTLDGLGPVGLNAHCSERSEDLSKDQEYALQSSFVPKALMNTLAIAQLLEKSSVLER